MEASNLSTASVYINNLLLARGLLRNGKSVDFASLASCTGKDGADTARIETTAQVINVVHDLILRRDRDQEQQETIAHTLQTLRGEATRNIADFNRLDTKHRDLARQLTQCQSTARSAQAQCTAAESSARVLREEVARNKATLAQVRTQCANDVRKRDVQIQRLKTHLTAQQRGSKSGMVGASITIHPGSTGRGHAGGHSVGPDGEVAPSLEDAEYRLKQETTEFLTQLSQSLSDENDSLISLIRGAVSTLGDLQGFSNNQQRKSSDGPGSSSLANEGNEHVQVLSASYDSLSVELASVLEGIRDLLTNPSFAPIEEVHVREEEIRRLRAGWEKMEGRWKEAVGMMKGWRERMLSGGNTIDLEDLKLGLGLGEDLDTIAPFGDNIQEVDEEAGAADADAMENIDSNLANLPEDEPSFSAPEPELVLDAKLNGFSGDTNSETTARQLREVNGNTCGRIGSRKRSREALDGAENSNDGQLPNGSGLPNVEVRDRSKKARVPSSKIAKPTKVPQMTRRRSLAGTDAMCHPSAAREPYLTVSEKLKHAESEARRASGEHLPPPSPELCGDEAQEDLVDDAGGEGFSGVAPLGSPARKTGIVGKPQRSRKRQSTLSPEELDNLLLAGAG